MSKNKKSGRGARPVWRGLTTVCAVLLAAAVMLQGLVGTFRTDIDKFLGTKSTVMKTDNDGSEDLYTFKSDYTSTKDLLDAIEDLGERMSEEGTVMLKNNGALPLTAEETQRVSLLGFSSYYPVRGGLFGGSILAENTGTDADTVDLVGALEARGFKLNPALWPLYQSLEDVFAGEVQTWHGPVPYKNAVSPSTDGYYTSKEPAQDVLDGADPNWRSGLAEYNVIIVTIARAGSENSAYLPGKLGVDPNQNLNQRDPLGLSDSERDLIQAAIDAKGDSGKVIVFINTPCAMELQELEDNDGVDAILEIGLPGGYGFYGIADILSGAANPSGHLADTYASTIANSPAAQNFGCFNWTNANAEVAMNSEIVQAEGIYIGYKYYETRYMDSVLGQGNSGDWDYDSEVTYPFGFGLSYTTFQQKLDSVNVDLASKTVTAEITVTNTGNVAGKDAVQFYVSLPYIPGGLEKVGVQLLDYAKTGEIAPGASEKVTLTADMQNMTSWDSSAGNAIGTTGNYILDPGDYYFTVGQDAHDAANNVLAAQGAEVDGDAANVQTWNLAQRDETTFAYTKNGTAVENHLQDMDINYWMPGTATYLSRSDWQGTWPKTYDGLTATDDMLTYLDNDIYEIGSMDGDPVTFGADNGMTLAELKGVSDINDPRWSQLMDQITLEECMIRIAYGGTSTKAINSIMSPEAIQNDGPNGIYSYPLGQYANKTDPADPCKVDENDPNLGYVFGTMGNETIIGQTFSKDLAREYGEVCGNYSLWANLTIYWGCGTNIHRCPYNARNLEYYAEDAILTAGQGNEFVQAGLRYGCLIAPKHLAFNDTEVNRTGIATFMTEQQARENELRCFQSIIENGCLAVMSAFNRVGVIGSNGHAGLMVDILREEWGFKGLISEDFIMFPVNYVMLKEAALNGVTMTCNTGEDSIAVVGEHFGYWTVENVSRDNHLMAGIKQAMTWQNYALAQSNALDGMSASSHMVTVRTWYDNAITGLEIASALLTVLCAVMYVRSGKKSKT